MVSFDERPFNNFSRLFSQAGNAAGFVFKKSLFFVFRPSSAELMVIIDGCVVLRQSRGDK